MVVVQAFRPALHRRPRPFLTLSGNGQLNGPIQLDKQFHQNVILADNSRRPTVAKNQAVMTTNPPIVQTAKLTGNTLTLVQKSAAGQPASDTTTTLMRVE